MPKRIPLTQGKFAIVDDEDYQELSKYKWYATYSKSTKSFYVRRSEFIKKTVIKIQMHRQIVNTSDVMVTDHINHDTLDHRKCNLRNCTPSQSVMNRRLQKNNKSGTAGVNFHKKGNKWRAYIQVNKKHIHLGYFDNISSATNARKEAEIKYFGEYAYNPI